MTEPQSLNEAAARVAESRKQLRDYVLAVAPQSWERAPDGAPGYEVADAMRALELQGEIETEWFDAASGGFHPAKCKMWRRAE